MILLRMYANRDGGLRPLEYSLSSGAMIWFLWTLPMAAAEWLFGILPAALFLHEDWLLKHRKRVLWASAFLGWMPALVKFKVWGLVFPDRSLSGWLFSLYSLIQVMTPLVAAMVYLRWTASKAHQESGIVHAP